MLLQLGSYKFEGIKLPQSWSNSYETIYGQIPIINGKPVVQKTGEKLDEITLGILLSIDFCTPQTELDNLQLLRKAGTVLPLIDGNGRNYGKFVITQIQTTNIQTLANGYPTTISANLSLLEYNTNQSVIIQSGAALASETPTAEVALAPNITPAGSIYADINTGTIASTNISKKVSATPTNNDYSKITEYADSGIASFNSANAKIEATEKIAYRAMDLKNVLTNCTSAFQDIKTACSIKNPSELLNANNRLESAVNEISGANAPIVAFMGSRESGN